MTPCNRITNSGVVCSKVWLQHENDDMLASVSMAAPPIGYQVSGPSVFVAPTQPPVSTWTPPSLNTQNANANRVNHYSAVPSSAFNASTARRSTGQRLVNPRPFNSQNVPVIPAVMTNVPFTLALMPYAVCFPPFSPHFTISDVTFSSSSAQPDQISLIPPGAAFVFIILRRKAFSSAFRTCSFLFLSASTPYLPFLLGNRLEIS
jgi:hypothetical protein